jgi:hypothetical protein
VLAAILMTSAVSAAVAPLLVAALLTEWLDHLRILARAGRVLQIAASALLVSMGAAMITGELSAFSYWLRGLSGIRADRTTAKALTCHQIGNLRHNPSRPVEKRWRLGPELQA